jgi:hypothetical protein
MDTKDPKIGYIARLLIGGFGAVLLALFALSAYTIWTVNAAYFHDYSWLRIGWGDMFWLIAALYFLLVGCIGKWRLERR